MKQFLLKDTRAGHPWHHSRQGVNRINDTKVDAKVTQCPLLLPPAPLPVYLI